MPIRHAQSVWTGTLKEGKGRMALGSGALEVPYSFGTRFEEAPGTNPEELIGAALSGCYSMFLAAVLTNDGFAPTEIRTKAKVTLGEGPRVTNIDLETEAVVPGVSEALFQDKVAFSKANCPISRALSDPEITVNARLIG